MTVKRVMGLRLLVDHFPEEKDGLMNVESKTDSGIVIPMLANSTKPIKGKIFMVGDEVNPELSKKNISPINVGDEILYDRNEYQVMVSDKKDYDLIVIQNIICIL